MTPNAKFPRGTIVRLSEGRTGKVEGAYPLTTHEDVEWIYRVRLLNEGSFVGGPTVDCAEYELKSTKVKSRETPGRRRLDDASREALELVLRLARSKFDHEERRIAQRFVSADALVPAAQLYVEFRNEARKIETECDRLKEQGHWPGPKLRGR
jgi:hypothetical protein